LFYRDQFHRDAPSFLCTRCLPRRFMIYMDT
jgi:hypothetical protein